MTRSRPRRTPKPANARHARVLAALATAAVLVATTAAGCGSNDGVVGGDCAPGYTQCNLSCVDLQTDPDNCGACGNQCGPGIACVSGICANLFPDATVGDDDGSTGDDGSVDAVDYIDQENCDANQPGCHRQHPDGSGDDDGSSVEGGGDDDNGEGGKVGDGGDGGDGSINPGGGEGGPGDGSTDGNTDGNPSDAQSDAPHDANPSDACVPPYDTAGNCGACGVSCSGTTPICSLEDGGYQCAPVCTPPLVDCGGRCVNLSRDPENCGTCGNVCPSQYCYLATCQGAVAGSIMVLGHDFSTSKSTDVQTKLLYNSVFYNPPTVRLLSFEHYANAAAVANAKSLLTAYATTNHYSLAIQVTNDDTFIQKGLTISNEDAVIIWDQSSAPTGTLGTLGTEWASSMAQFTQAGGIVIVLDAAQGTGEMPALLTKGALLAVTGHATYAAGNPAAVPLAGQSIARLMTSTYAVFSNTAYFTTSEVSSSTTLFVANVQGQTGELLAVQKVVN